MWIAEKVVYKDYTECDDSRVYIFDYTDLASVTLRDNVTGEERIITGDELSEYTVYNLAGGRFWVPRAWERYGIGIAECVDLDMDKMNLGEQEDIKQHRGYFYYRGRYFLTDKVYSNGEVSMAVYRLMNTINHVQDTDMSVREDLFSYSGFYMNGASLLHFLLKINNKPPLECDYYMMIANDEPFIFHVDKKVFARYCAKCRMLTGG